MSDWLAVANHAVAEFEAMQKPSELAAMLQLLDGREVTNVLEIGGMFGGTAWAWDHVRLNNGTLVCVDNFSLEGRLENLPDHGTLVQGNSTAVETRERVRNELDGGELFDFIFVDGDHRYLAVLLDAANWRPLLAEGGWMAFHDICHRRMIQHDMWRFWQEIRADHHSVEIYDSAQSWGGIGVISEQPFPADLPLHCYHGGWLPMPAQCAPVLCDRCLCELNLDEEGICRDCAA